MLNYRKFYGNLFLILENRGFKKFMDFDHIFQNKHVFHPQSSVSGVNVRKQVVDRIKSKRFSLKKQLLIR